MDKPNIVGYKVDKSALFERVGYRPMEHQWEYHNSDARFRLPCCGRRTGKTMMVANERTAELFKPKHLGWIVGPTYDLGAKEFRIIYENITINLGLGKKQGVKSNFNIRQGDMYIEMPWGARLEVRSATQPDKLVGEGLSWVIMSEAAKHDQETWEKYVRPALADKKGGADFPTTPEGKNWYYELWKKGRRNDISSRSSYESWRFPSWVNDVVFPGGYEDDEIQEVRETTIEEWFLQEYAAEFTAIVGRILGQFDEEEHVLSEPYQFNPDWPNYIAFDWGYTAPLAAVEFQISPRDEVFVWREHYVRSRTLEWHINEIKNRENPEGYRLDMAFGDAADPEAVEYVSQHLVYCMAEAESKDWMPGIRLMQELMTLKHDGIAYDEHGIPIMRPRYHVDATCINHIDEVLGYRARKGVSALANEYKGSGIVDPKVSDHTIDAVRYGLMHKFKVGVNTHLSDIYPAWSKTQRTASVNAGSTRRAGNKAPLELALSGSNRVDMEGRKKNGTFFTLNNITPGGRF